MVACGSLLRDSGGRWRGEFAKKLGSCGVLQAEMWGICVILELAWTFGYRFVLLETDSCSWRWGDVVVASFLAA